MITNKLKSNEGDMKQRYISILSILLIAVPLGIACKTQLSANQAYKIGKAAYIYGYPLVLMALTEQEHLKRVPINTFAHARVFPNASFTYIVSPNVDTLYSTAWLDLKNGPIILKVPNTHGRYYVLELMDAWTNVFASIGKRTTGTHAQAFAICGPGRHGELPKGVERIDAPTNTVWILGRIQTDGKKDFAVVHRLQDQLSLTPLHAANGNKAHDVNPAVFTIKPAEKVEHFNAETFFTKFASLLKENSAPMRDRVMINDLAKIGIDANNIFDFKQLPIAIQKSLEKAVRDGLHAIKTSTLKTGTLVNGWFIADSKKIGNYGTDYEFRAIVALKGLGANLAADAVYPFAEIDSNNQPLTGAKNYIVHFGPDQLPPVHAFWSLTIYNEDHFLVKNILNKYAIHFYDNLVYNDDGSLDILIQHAKPENISNWLPAPQGAFNLVLRLYWPDKEVLNGQWKPPRIQVV